MSSSILIWCHPWSGDLCIIGGQIISNPDPDADYEALLNELSKEFEQQHPDITIEDLRDFNTQLPEDMPFGKVVNQVKKNLVTIAQTSGCLTADAYNYAIPFSAVAICS